MPRTADYVIQGFMYQFQSTLQRILESAPDASIIIEGIVEDIEVMEAGRTTAIQCKYHETKTDFVNSAIYNPLLKMMRHYQDHMDDSIEYILFAHFPNEKLGKKAIGVDVLKDAVKTEDGNLLKIAAAIRGDFSHEDFLARFTLQIGHEYDELADKNRKLLGEVGFQQDTIDVLTYPNAINMIAHISIKHDVAERRIQRREFLEELHRLRATAISKWTLSLRGRDAILKARRRQLKPNLSRNARSRYFLLNPESVDKFWEEVVVFICDYLAKYHYKQVHQHTPIFCVDCVESQIDDVQWRLYQKGVTSERGYIAKTFDGAHFLRDPLTLPPASQREVTREFDIRLLHISGNFEILSRKKCDDLFILGACDISGFDAQDVCLEKIEASNFLELKYLLGISDAAE